MGYRSVAFSFVGHCVREPIARTAVVNNQSISLLSNINRLKIARTQIWQITRQIAFIQLDPDIS